MLRRLMLSATLLTWTGLTLCHAQGLRVEPILLEIGAPAATGTITLHADSGGAAAQIRVMRWTQKNGAEALETTEDVVASPPMTKIEPNSDFLVRIVRVNPQPVVHEEAYRLLVDEIPEPTDARKRSVSVLIRQSIPVFFRPVRDGVADVKWSIEHNGGVTTLVAQNTGDDRMRMASLRLMDSRGKHLKFGDGLFGYVLAGSSMRFPLVKAPHGFGAGPVKLSLQTQSGPVSATAD